MTLWFSYNTSKHRLHDVT